MKLYSYIYVVFKQSYFPGQLFDAFKLKFESCIIYDYFC